MHRCIHACIHAYIHTYIHTPTHTHIDMSKPAKSPIEDGRLQNSSQAAGGLAGGAVERSVGGTHLWLGDTATGAVGPGVYDIYVLYIYIHYSKYMIIRVYVYIYI